MDTSRQDLFLKNKTGKFNTQNNIVKFNNKINNIKIAIIGCGGVGSPLAQLLVRGGFNNLLLVDNDMIDESNLQRQIYNYEDIGKIKSTSLKFHLEKINPNIKIELVEDIIVSQNIDEILKDSEFIIDATDDFEVRRLINSYCEKTNKFWQYNAAVMSEIMTCIFSGKENKFDKVFPPKVSNISCCEVGVLASTTFISAGIAYQELLKFFIENKYNNLIKFNIWDFKIYNFKV